MTPLAANLRHLVQRRGMWLLYALMALMTLPVVMMFVDAVKDGGGAGRGAFALPLLIAWCVGAFMADHAIGVLCSHVSFCLPGHLKVGRQFLVIVGVAVSALLALVFLAYPGLPWSLRGMAVVEALSANLACYGLGTMAAASRQMGLVAGAIYGWTWLLALVAAYFDLHVAVVDAITEGNLPFMGVCWIMSGLFWSRWDNRDLTRRFCGTLRVTAFDGWNTEKMRRAAQARWAANRVRPNATTAWIERLFLGRMHANRATGTSRAIWGGLYATFGWIGPSAHGLIVMVVILALYFGYLGTEVNWFVFAFASIMAGNSFQPPVYSTLPVPRGRKERFLAGIGVVLVGCVLTAIVLTGVVALTCLVAPRAPELSLRGHAFSFRPMQSWWLWVPWAVVPAVQAARLTWPKSWIITSMVVFALSPIVILSKQVFLPWSVPIVAALLIAGWSAFLAVHHWACFRRDLVLQ